MECAGGDAARIACAILLCKADTDNEKTHKLIADASYLESKHWLSALEVSLGRNWAGAGARRLVKKQDHKESKPTHGQEKCLSRKSSGPKSGARIL